MSRSRDLESRVDDLGDRVRRYAGDVGDTAQGWMARGRRSVSRLGNRDYGQRVSRAAEDLADEAMNKKLVGHLHSDDFFSIEKNPTSTLKITKVAPGKDGKMEITGDLTIKGITPKDKKVTFPAEVHVTKEGVHAAGTMTVDRTAYNIKYNSLKFFSSIGDKAIADTFTVTFDLIAKK